MIKKIILALVFLMSAPVSSQQKSINNYKYIIVPNKFDFLSSEDKYKTSSLTKFLLKKKGFVVFKSDEDLPSDLSKDKCLALTANVIDNSGMFSVKSNIEFRDCNNALVYISKEGKSKKKLYEKAYHESIRNAYNSMTDVTYSYQPIKTEIKQDVVSVAPKSKKIPIKEKVEITEISQNNKVPILYAQPIKNGFQLVDTKPTVIFQLLKTNRKDYYIIKDKNGILYKNANYWIAEFYEADEFVVKKYQIKF